MTPASPRLLETDGFFGNYHVVRMLGHGGTGQVYLVDGPDAGTRYALKLLDPDMASKNEEFVHRFIREAEFSMEARHPNLVEVYDAGKDDETGLCYLAMEYMVGGTLRNLLRAEGALSVSGAVAIARDIARALVFAEQNQLVHRDVKPDNILFTEDGRAKLTDLGIALFTQKDGNDKTRTMEGRVVGSVGYMSPEQMINAHDVDIRADIYSLGVILYEMLAGERPNAADSAINSLAKALQGDVLPDIRERRPDVPERLALLISEMTEPSAADRPASAAALLARLESPDLLANPAPERAPTVRPADAPARAPASMEDWLFSSGVNAVIIALIVLAGVIVFLFVRK